MSSSDIDAISKVAPTDHSSGEVSAVASESDEQLITLTVLTTSIHTMLSCAPAVTDCPVNFASQTSLPEGMSTVLITETLELSTTVCPVTAAESISASILSMAARGGITGKVFVPSSTQDGALGSSLVALSGVSTGAEATPVLPGQVEPTSLVSEGNSTFRINNQGRPSGLRAGVPSAPYQAAVSTTLQPVVKKPCHHH